nr:ribonuclease H-like domain-containing protein [Tanacetum cinerariifolium]
MLHMGDQSADEYFSKIDSLVTLLSDLGSDVSEDEVVTYAINGLSDKYGSLAQIIAHRDPFPYLATMRSMVSTEEMRLWSKSLIQPTNMNASAPQVLLAASNIPRGGDNHNTRNRDDRKPNTSTEEPADLNWNMDTAASSHLNYSISNLSTIFNSCMYPSVRVGDGKSISVTNTGHSTLRTPHRTLHLNNVLITPNIVKNLIAVRQFVRDNKCTIEFDEFDFSVKDFLTRQILLRCDSTGDLYPVTSP